MASASLKHGLFALGMLLMLHGFYMAYTRREYLQAVHHGRSYVPAVPFAGTALSAHALMVPITLEMLVGFTLAIFAFVSFTRLKPARLIDQAKYLRYDRQMHTGVNFVHFNHRGKLAGRSEMEAGGGGDGGKDERQKKME